MLRQKVIRNHGIQRAIAIGYVNACAGLVRRGWRTNRTRLRSPSAILLAANIRAGRMVNRRFPSHRHALIQQQINAA